MKYLPANKIDIHNSGEEIGLEFGTQSLGPNKRTHVMVVISLPMAKRLADTLQQAVSQCETTQLAGESASILQSPPI